MASIKRFHPGVYIKDTLEAIEMTSRELSMRTGISERTLSSIISCKGSITFDIAYKLSIFFGNSVIYWMNLQTQYDMYMRESKIEQEIDDDWNLIKKNIKKYLLDFGYINLEDDKMAIVSKCRTLAGVTNLALLNKKDSFTCFKEQHVKNEVDYFSQNFWIALALNEARKKNGISYDRKKLIDSIDEIRKMTVQDPHVFYPKLIEIFTGCGISFVLLPYLSKSNIYGATKWFSKENVMLAISNRGERADSFWFTLFHEISHIMLEHRREMLISYKGKDDLEADRSAADMLIPRDEWNLFTENGIFTIESIDNFAKKVGVLPCIVLGRLHKEFPNDVPFGKFDRTFNVSYRIV